jgi:hypothetical protein
MYQLPRLLRLKGGRMRCAQARLPLKADGAASTGASNSDVDFAVICDAQNVVMLRWPGMGGIIRINVLAWRLSSHSRTSSWLVRLADCSTFQPRQMVFVAQLVN